MKFSNNTYQKPLNSCEQTGKVVYASRELAIAAMQYLNRFQQRGVPRMRNAYKCNHCNGFHLKSQEPKSKSKNRRA